MNEFKVGDRVLVWRNRPGVIRVVKTAIVDLDSGHEMFVDCPKPDPAFNGFHVGDKVNIHKEYGTYTISKLEYVNSVPSAHFNNVNNNREITATISSLTLIESGDNGMKPIAEKIEWRPISEYNGENAGVVFTNGKSFSWFNEKDITHFFIIPPFPKPELKTIDLTTLTQDKQDAIRKIMNT